MFWWILGIVCLAFLILGIVLYKIDYDFGFIMAFIAGFVLIIPLLVIPIGTISSKQNLVVFKQHKEYIETHKSVDSIEDAALTNKKIELNSWLFGAQYAKKHYEMFVFYPDEVLDLQPIE